jgi:predicted transcriptional regulator
MKTLTTSIGADRAAAIFAAYSSGATLQEVGERYGISRERVRKILKAHGYPVRSVKEAAALRRASERVMAPQITALCSELGEPREVADRLGVSYVTVREVIRLNDVGDLQPASAQRRKLRKTQKLYTNEELLECLKMASGQLGGVLTASAYSEFIRDRALSDGRPWPSHQALQLRFGSWREALRQAGLRANPASAIAGQRIFEAAHCIDAVRHVARELGHSPTAAEYDLMARASRGGLPCVATVRRRFGGWLDALGAAGL